MRPCESGRGQDGAEREQTEEQGSGLGGEKRLRGIGRSGHWQRGLSTRVESRV